MTLKEYLEKNSLVHSKFASKCKIDKGAFSKFVNGTRKPTVLCAMIIKKESKGRVTEFDSIINNHLDLIRKSASI